jgi:lipopolysaccharide export LptBFGC system permease protein LptF
MFNAVGEGLVIYAERIEPRANRLHGILLSDERKPGTRTTILAQSAELRGDVPARDLLLRLEQGTSVTFQPDASNHDTTVFGSLEVHLDSGSAAAHGNVSRAPRVELMYPGALYEDAVSIAPERQHSLEASLELHRRGAFAVGTLLLALLGVALGNRPARSARALGLAVSVGVAVAYQSALTVTGALARRHTLSAAAAMWAPDLVLALATAMLLARAALEASPPSLLGYLGFRPRALG